VKRAVVLCGLGVAGVGVAAAVWLASSSPEAQPIPVPRQLAVRGGHVPAPLEGRFEMVGDRVVAHVPLSERRGEGPTTVADFATRVRAPGLASVAGEEVVDTRVPGMSPEQVEKVLARPAAADDPDTFLQSQAFKEERRARRRARREGVELSHGERRGMRRLLHPDVPPAAPLP
jgi:hypothetical protein